MEHCWSLQGRVTVRGTPGNNAQCAICNTLCTLYSSRSSSAVPGSIFCNQHKCQCGGGKRAQAVCCDVCMHRPPLGPEELISARQDPELPVTIFAEQMCTYRSPQTGARFVDLCVHVSCM